MKMIVQHFAAEPSHFEISKYNSFDLVSEGVTKEKMAVYQGGQIIPIDCLIRGERRLPLAAAFLAVHHALTKHNLVKDVADMAVEILIAMKFFDSPEAASGHAIDALETMLAEGWINGSVVPNEPFIEVFVPTETKAIHPSTQNAVSNSK